MIGARRDRAVIAGEIVYFDRGYARLQKRRWTGASGESNSQGQRRFRTVIARGFAVIEALGKSPGRRAPAEVAVLSQLNRATARRMLATLVALNYCEADGRHCRLRPRALALGLSYLTAPCSTRVKVAMRAPKPSCFARS